MPRRSREFERRRVLKRGDQREDIFRDNQDLAKISQHARRGLCKDRVAGACV